MSVLVVIENPEECSLSFTGIEPVAARIYLTDNSFFNLKGVKVFNICQSYRYQSIGYYVSLLAEARKHKPIPNTTTIQDMKSVGIIRLISDELDEFLQKQLSSNDFKKMSLNIYFGKCIDKNFENMASKLFKYFPSPFLKADFTFQGYWQMTNISPLAIKEIPEEERHFAQSVASEFFAGKKLFIPKRSISRYDIAILTDPKEKRPPSNAKALKKFVKAAESLNIGTEFITKDDSNRLSEFDGLFIRETTNVHHHTYRMARKAAAEGLVVIDDPESILRCSNKVFLAELLNLNKIPIPKTRILHAKNIEQISSEFKFPCILKEPDSSFSQGVVMADNSDDFYYLSKKMLKGSDLLIVQEYIPSEYDWRIGILDQRPLFACKYYMAQKHWQIVGKDKAGKDVYGKVDTVPVGIAPKNVVKIALKAANLIGDGLYGVDLKQIDDKVYIIEINDNPNIDTGLEDEVLQDELYLKIMEVFLKRIETSKFRRIDD
ncbi:MAG: RimK family protein [Desulfobacterales bacterium]|nr:RimK family protein [Desulfobacterales bacterium]